MDGGWIPSRDQAGGMEGKVAVVATGRIRIGQHADGSARHVLWPRRYVATFGTSTQLGRLTYWAATQIDGDRAIIQLVLGDGAGWITTETGLHFPRAIRILDWDHLQRTVHKAIRAARPGAAQRAERQRLHRTIPDRLWVGDVAGALEQLRDLRPATGELITGLEHAITYIDDGRDGIGNYEAWRAAGYLIGSGLDEREVAIVINRRMKKRGMRWLRVNAGAVVALRTNHLNARWEEQSAQVARLAA
jgi:hypothetical protein